jgi:hypothetical protein
VLRIGFSWKTDELTVLRIQVTKLARRLVAARRLRRTAWLARSALPDRFLSVLRVASNNEARIMEVSMVENVILSCCVALILLNLFLTWILYRALTEVQEKNQRTDGAIARLYEL